MKVVINKLVEFIKNNPIITIVISVIFILLIVFFTLVLTKPKIYTEDIIRLEVSSGKRLEKPKTTYFFKDITDKVKMTTKINYTKLGKYEVIYTIPILFRTIVKTQVVEIVDTTPPIITLTGGDNINYSYSKTYKEVGVSATDNYDGDLTSKIITEKTSINESEFEIKYTVTDSSNNTTAKTRHVTLIDDISPIITLKGLENMRVQIGNTYQEPGANAYDEKDGDLTNAIEITGSVDTSKIGTYTITYKVADQSGNITEKNRTVTVYYESKYYPPATGQTIYLTFDDGPSAYTYKLLDVLQKYNVKATFFVTNQGLTKGHDVAILRAYNEGHTIGLHTYTHNYKTVYSSEEAYFNDLYAIQNKVKEITGYESKIIRFPGGSSNTISKFNPGIMTRLTSEVELRGFRYFDWNVSSGDAGGASTSSEVINNVVKSLKSGRTYVVLQHDIKNFSVDAVESIIEYGLSHGYTFAPLTMESPTVHHGVNN